MPLAGAGAGADAAGGRVWLNKPEGTARHAANINAAERDGNFISFNRILLRKARNPQKVKPRRRMMSEEFRTENSAKSSVPERSFAIYFDSVGHWERRQKETKGIKDGPIRLHWLRLDSGSSGFRGRGAAGNGPVMLD
jgi:hypothetical protein